MLEKWRNNITKTKLLAAIYFFFNTFGLPAPLTFTSILWLLDFKKLLIYRKLYISILAILSFYVLIHFNLGVETFDYLQSFIFLIFLISSGILGYNYLTSHPIEVNSLFRWLSLASFLLFIFGLFAIFTPFWEIFWKNHSFLNDGDYVWRFKALSYEPSHLALTLSPIFLYFSCKILKSPKALNFLYLALISISIIFTFSFGFVAALIFTAAVTMAVFLFHVKRFPKKTWRILSIIFIVLFSGIYFTSNPVSERIDHIFAGKDTSVNGRTVTAFYLGYKCAEERSIWFGIGLGQVKHIGEKVIRPFYAKSDPVGYNKENWPVLSIPNSMAETLAIFGIFGVLLKIGFQFFCFWRFKLHHNYFNLSLFAFIFSYQLMGSFILSSTEIMMWALAFARIYPEFDINRTNTLSE